MSERADLQIPKIEKSDIEAPKLEIGSSVIVFQRHKRYELDPASDNAGSLLPDSPKDAYDRDKIFFKTVLSQDEENSQTMVLFVSSDTQYAGKGRRSMETAQLAQDAAIQVMKSMGLEPSDRILNLHPSFKVDGLHATNQSIRPDPKIREPQMFEKPEYVGFLGDKYGYAEGPGLRLSPEAWAMHEMDAEREVREEFGAEGVHDILDRTKRSLAILERYARVFHANNLNKKLVIWVSSHYDTISPLVKDATSTGFDEYVPVDYGAGVVIEMKPGSEPILNAQNQKVQLDLGSIATSARR